MKHFKRYLPFLLILAILLPTISAVNACPACPGYVEDPLHEQYTIYFNEPNYSSHTMTDYGYFLFPEVTENFIGYDFIGWYYTSMRKGTSYYTTSLKSAGSSGYAITTKDYYALFGKVSENGYEYYTTYMDDNEPPFPVGHSLSLENGIAVNFLIKKEYLAQYDDVIIETYLPKYYSELDFEYKEVAYSVRESGEYRVFTVKDINATQIDDQILFKIKLFKDNRSLNAEDKYAISTYAYSQLNKTTSSEPLKALCANLIQYGAWAQRYKNYLTIAYVDSMLKEEHRKYLTDLNTVEFETTNKEFDDLEDPSVQWIGKTLDLKSNIALKTYIDCSNYAGSPAELQLKILYIDIHGDEQVTYGDKCTVYQEDKNLFTISFSHLPATDLRVPLALCIVDPAGNQVSTTIHYSLASYGNGKTGDLLTLCQALLAYSDAAAAFVGR